MVYILSQLEGIAYPPSEKFSGSGTYSHSTAPIESAANSIGGEGSGDQPRVTNCSDSLISEKLKILPKRERPRRKGLHGLNRAIFDRNLTRALEIFETSSGETGDRAISSLRAYQRMMGGAIDG
jgi:hypothetical protein